MTLFFQELVNGAVVGSTYAVVALGFALVFVVMRVVNMAHPEILMIAMYAAVVVSSVFPASVVIVIAGSVAVAAAVGSGIERTVLRPLRGRSLLIPLIATAGVAMMLENLVAGWFGVDPVRTPQLVPDALLTVGSIYVTWSELMTIASALVMMVLVSIYVRRTSWGRATRALAERPDVTAAFGVNVNRISQFTVVLASVLAGLAGLLLSSQYHITSPFIAGPYTLKAFICMLVAGNRHIEAVMATGVLLGTLEVMVNTYVSSSLGDAVAFCVLIFVLYFRSGGLFGSYGEYLY